MRAILFTLLSAGALSAQSIAITGATVYPVSGPRIENATVVITNGRITAVGANVAVPAGATTVDGRGKWVTPGFINGATNLGLSEAGNPTFSGGYADGGARGDNAGISASFEAWKGLNPLNTYIAPARQEGVTSVVVAPNDGMVGGTAAVIDLIEATSAAAMVRRAPVVMTGSFSNPGSGQTNSRAEFWAKWRALIADVRAYQSRRAAYESGSTRDFITKQSELEALIPVAAGRLPLVLNVDRSTDILAALDFARETNVRIWLAGASEGWMVAREIAAARVPVFVGAMNNIPGSFDQLGARQENAAMLRTAGVTVVLIGNGPGGPNDWNVRNIRQEAGNAVAYGMSWDDALRSITLTAAEVLGVADRVGSIQAGRDANVVIWSGDPFEFSSVAERVFIQGREFTTKSRQQLLTERYLTLPPAYRRP
jgi:imidazolonepropionase-like amidohydrolase